MVLSTHITCTALSYAWGDKLDSRNIRVGDDASVTVRDNLWWFLYLQSLTISEPVLFWIDAICINQSNVHERNHQVGLMKRIYANATNVFIWLGREARCSDTAMDFVSGKGTRKLKIRGSRFIDLWTPEEGKALWDLFERPYWRRMWIIQEIIHAN